ncbi:B3 domain-containing protein Os03g0212300-like [Salvia hispanica]|uniref:B3 domain-containing protein Os03g0212300-like n=1 Tax=Salvia hispanica TaxID=49212 RepID=UPI0020091C62|nr:B3 domain-containing protein Os03g0212300-like [Salvia hispanica]
MAQPLQLDPNGIVDDAYPEKPSFLKRFNKEKNIDNIRIPPEFVAENGNSLPFRCRLVLPNKRSWEVVLLNIASGCHFRTGWSDFVRDNNLRDGDTLAFTLVSDGIFDVKRYLARSGCPPRRDIEVPDSEDEYDAPHSPDIDTSEDDEPSDTEPEISTGCSKSMSALALAEYDHPTFVVVLTKSSIKKSLEISVDFWRKHIRASALDEPIYFTAETGGTWLLELAHTERKIWVKKGWGRFKNDNRLVPGVQCTFQLVDVKEIHFYVHFDH